MNPYKRSAFVRIMTTLVYIFLYVPIFVLIIYSFNSSKTNINFEGFIDKVGPTKIVKSNVEQSPCGAFHWYCELAKNRDVGHATKNTLTIATISTLTSTVIGTLAALALSRYKFPLKSFSELALYIPIVIPEIVMGIGILILFSQSFSFLNNFFNIQGDNQLGMGMFTIIVSHIAFSVPFVTLVVRARLQGMDQSYEEAAMDLGANELITFWRVTLPMLIPGVISGGLMAFTLSLDDFVITFFTNGPGSTTLPIYVYGLLRRIVTPEVNALSTIWILIVFAAVAIMQFLQGREKTA